MVNQWGRDGSFGSGNTGSRSAAGVIIAAVLALIVGAAGGYAGARFFSGVSEADIARRDQHIAELDKTLSEMKFDSHNATGQQAALQQRVKDLQTQVDQLKRTKTPAKDDSAAEIAALKKTIEEAGDLSGQLARARKSMKASDLQVTELQKTVSDQKTEIGKLQAAAQQQGDVSNSAAFVALQDQKVMLEAQVDTLRKQLDQARNGAADIQELKSRIAALQDEAAKASDDADRKTAQVTSLQKQKDDLQARLDAAGKSTDAASQQAGRIADLQKQLDNMAESLAERDDDARKADDALKAAKADLGQSRDRIKALADQNALLSSDRDGLQKQVDSLKAAIAQLQSAQPSAGNQPPPADQGNNDQNDNGLTPRKADDVQKAVADLPGYDGLAADKQAVLVDMLEKGACVTDALRATYGHVSPISLRSLFRDLGGSC